MRPKIRGPVRHALPIVCGLTALALLTSQGAFAQTIPSYATNAHCQRVAGFGGTFSQSVYGSCLNMEQSAALALQNRWSSIPASVRERCDRTAKNLIITFDHHHEVRLVQLCFDFYMIEAKPENLKVRSVDLAQRCGPRDTLDRQVSPAASPA